MDDDINSAVAGLTGRVIAYRIALMVYRGNRMPLEIKGIRGKALKAAANLDRINAAYDAFNEAAPAHASDVEGLTPQITALHDDLTFATQVLGNSSGAGEKPADPPKPAPAVTTGETTQTTVRPPEVEQTAAATFQDK